MAAVFTDIDLSFKKHPISKDLIKKTDVDAVRQSLKNLFLISPMEMHFNSRFGVGLQALMFENLSPPMIGVIQRKIREQINQYEPRCVIENIDVKEDGDNGIAITLLFHVSGAASNQTFNFVLERTR